MAFAQQPSAMRIYWRLVPVARKKEWMKRVEVVLGIILRGGQILVCRRHDTGAFAGLWEFPGGKRDDDEPIQDALARELIEELGVKVRITGSLDALDFDYPTIHVHLIPLLCAIESGEAKPLASQELKWVPCEQLRAMHFPEANATLIEQIIAHVRGGTDA